MERWSGRDREKWKREVTGRKCQLLGKLGIIKKRNESGTAKRKSVSVYICCLCCTVTVRERIDCPVTMTTVRSEYVPLEDKR